MTSSNKTFWAKRPRTLLAILLSATTIGAGGWLVVQAQKMDAEYADLTRGRASLETLIASLTDRRSGLETRISQLQEQVGVLEGTLAGLRGQEAEAKRLSGEVASLRGTVLDLEKRRADAVREQEVAARERLASERQHDGLMLRIEARQQTVQDIERELEKLRDDERRAKDAATEIAQRRDALENEVTSSRLEREELRVQIAALKAELADYGTLRTDLAVSRTRKASLDAENVEIEKRLAGLRDQEAKLRALLYEKSEEATGLDETLAGLRARTKSLRVEEEVLGKRVPGLQEEILSLEERKTSLEASVARLTSDQTALEQQFSDLQVSRESAETALRDTEGEFEDQLQALREARSKLAAVIGRVEGLEGKRDSLEAQQAHLEEQIPLKQEALTVTKADLATIQARLAEDRGELDQIMLLAAEQRAMAAALQRRVTSLEAEERRLGGEVSRLDALREAATNDRNAVRKELDQLTVSLGKTQAQRDTALAEWNGLAAGLSDLEAQKLRIDAEIEALVAQRRELAPEGEQE